jgi:hypothetical protein
VNARPVGIEFEERRTKKEGESGDKILKRYFGLTTVEPLHRRECVAPSGGVRTDCRSTALK